MVMTVRDLTNRIENGSSHILLIDGITGEVILKTIWYNEIPRDQLDRQVIKIKVTDYTLTLTIK